LVSIEKAPHEGTGPLRALTVELVQKGFCDFQIGRLEALGKPIVDQCEQVARLLPSAHAAQLRRPVSDIHESSAG